ncbi:MAG: hypothetical protein ACMVP2_01150 [Imperialibacter sp.]|uniref:hypothetical protein n=1 Tax=Imperialibacter sp. TaxID=2038411 RepID=UPI003A84FE50
MAKGTVLLDFNVDDLTNSIRNTVSGDSFPTIVTNLTKTDLKNVTKKQGWNFDWRAELKNDRLEVYKLTITNNPGIVQGIISVSLEPDHIFMKLLEGAPFNVGKNKLYEGVAGNLVAYACKLSFMNGYEGFVAFSAKTNLIQHYERTLGAYHFGGHKMIIPTESSRKLVERYFKE